MTTHTNQEEIQQNQQNLEPTITDGKYKTLFEQVNAAALLTTYPGQILEANNHSYDLLGYNWNEILRLSLKNLLSRDVDWDQFKDEVAARGGLNLETEAVCKNGNHLPVEVSVSLFTMNKNPVMFVLIWDISQRKETEKKLRESEKKYHGLFEFTTDGIFVLDARGDILDVNTKMCEMLDMSKNDLNGKNLFGMDFLSQQSLPIVVSQFEQLLHERTANNYTTEVQLRNGNVMSVEISSFFLVKKDNEVDNFVLIIRDITSRSLIERRRVREHELLMTLMDNIPDSVYFKDEQNRFILVNKAKADHWGVAPEDMIGKTDFDFLPKDQAYAACEDESQVMNTGQAVVNKVEKLTHVDGCERWISVTKIPRYDPDGSIIGTIGISRDITPLEVAKEELEKSEQRYRSIFENVSFAIVLTDELGRIISWNKLVEDLLGFSHDDLFMKRIDRLYSAEEWSRVQVLYDKNDGSQECVQTKILTKDKQMLDVDVSVNVVRNQNNEIIGATQIIGDVSEWKQLKSMGSGGCKQ